MKYGTPFAATVYLCPFYSCIRHAIMSPTAFAEYVGVGCFNHASSRLYTL